MKNPKIRPKMPVSERAKQFMPFAALKGLPEALAEREKTVVPQKELSEDQAEERNRALKKLSPGKRITVTYDREDKTIKKDGLIARIDYTERILQVVDTKIPFDQILDIKCNR